MIGHQRTQAQSPQTSAARKPYVWHDDQRGWRKDGTTRVHRLRRCPWPTPAALACCRHRPCQYARHMLQPFALFHSQRTRGQPWLPHHAACDGAAQSCTACMMSDVWAQSRRSSGETDLQHTHRICVCHEIRRKVTPGDSGACLGIARRTLSHVQPWPCAARRPSLKQHCSSTKNMRTSSIAGTEAKQTCRPQVRQMMRDVRSRTASRGAAAHSRAPGCAPAHGRGRDRGPGHRDCRPRRAHPCTLRAGCMCPAYCASHCMKSRQWGSCDAGWLPYGKTLNACSLIRHSTVQK